MKLKERLWFFMKLKNFLKKNAMNIIRVVLVIVLATMVITAVSCSSDKADNTTKQDDWHYYSVEISDYSHENYRHGGLTTENAHIEEFVSVEEHNFETVTLDGNELKFCLDCGWNVNEDCEDYHDYRFIREIEGDKNSGLYVCAKCGAGCKLAKHNSDECNYLADNGDYLNIGNSAIGGFVDDSGYKKICEVCKKTAITHKHENIGNAYFGNTEMYAKAEDVPACGDWCKDCYYVYAKESHNWKLLIRWGRAEKQIAVGGTSIEYDNENNICYFLKCDYCEAEVLLNVVYSDMPMTEKEIEDLASKYSAVIVDERT